MLNFGGVTLFTPMFPPALGAASFEGGSYVYESTTMMMMMMMMMIRECTWNLDDEG